MDLGTMTKKLNKCEYLSKAEFQHDINLIVNNCRTYNTDPVRKVNQLLSVNAFKRVRKYT